MTLIGSGGSGKTTLAETLLHHCKVTTRKGSVEEKNTLTDWDEEEKERQHSILATPVHMRWDGRHINLIDTPGALDYIGEAVCGLAASETAILCINAHDGVSVATRRLFRAARDLGMACVIAITRLEFDNVDAHALVDQIQSTIGERAVPINLPDTFGHDVSQVVDIFGDDVPENLQEAAAKYRQQVTDRVVECDDDLLES